jgi:hypothetical protein
MLKGVKYYMIFVANSFYLYIYVIQKIYIKTIMKHAILCLLAFCSFTVNAQKLTSAEKVTIVSRLEKTYDLDQNTRSDLNKCNAENGPNSVDSINQQVVFAILDKYGWLQKRDISEKAGKAFFYVIQHANLVAQSKYAPLIDEANRRNEIAPIEYAYFVDRLRTKQGKAQLYGTQSASDNLGNNYMYPVEDWHLADSLRKIIYAPTMEEEYIKSGQVKYYDSPKIDFSKHAIIIGHIWDNRNKPIDNLNVIIDSRLIGKSDTNGFFLLEIDKLKGKDINITLQKEGFKSINYLIKGSQDFYEVFAQTRPIL